MVWTFRPDTLSSPTWRIISRRTRSQWYGHFDRTHCPLLHGGSSQEEPGVNGMDISTGHIVLSYMEDHLKKNQESMVWPFRPDTLSSPTWRIISRRTRSQWYGHFD